jgi:hypothetical protein
MEDFSNIEGAMMALVLFASLILPMVMIGLMILSQAFWVWMIIDCCTGEHLDDNSKIVWILVIIFANWIGAIIYFCAGRKKKQTPPPLRSAGA